MLNEALRNGSKTRPFLVPRNVFTGYYRGEYFRIPGLGVFWDPYWTFVEGLYLDNHRILQHLHKARPKRLFVAFKNTILVIWPK